MIYKSGSKLPKCHLMIFGLSEIFDGLVTFLSFGVLQSKLSMQVISHITKRYHQKQMKGNK